MDTYKNSLLARNPPQVQESISKPDIQSTVERPQPQAATMLTTEQSQRGEITARDAAGRG